jgi:hypothetical protein
MRRTVAAALAALALGILVSDFERTAAVAQQAPAKETQKEAPLHRGGYINSYIALLKSDLKSRKVGFITEGMHLSDKDAAVFWPIYRSYESDLKQLDEARRQLIENYTANYTRLTDAGAKEKVERRLELEGRRVELEKRYFKQFARALPVKTAARFFQLEYRFRLLTDIKIISEVPLIE